MDSNPGLWASQSVPLTSCQLPLLRLTPRPTRLQREKWTHPLLPVTSPSFLLVPLPPSLEYGAQQGLLTSWPFFKVLQQACLLSPCFKGVACHLLQGQPAWVELHVPDISIKHSCHWPFWKCKWQGRSALSLAQSAL